MLDTGHQIIMLDTGHQIIMLDIGHPTRMLLSMFLLGGGGITVQTEGDLDLNADERDQQWENNDEDDDEGERNECFTIIFAFFK